MSDRARWRWWTFFAWSALTLALVWAGSTIPSVPATGFDHALIDTTVRDAVMCLAGVSMGIGLVSFLRDTDRGDR